MSQAIHHFLTGQYVWLYTCEYVLNPETNLFEWKQMPFENGEQYPWSSVQTIKEKAHPPFETDYWYAHSKLENVPILFVLDYMQGGDYSGGIEDKVAFADFQKQYKGITGWCSLYGSHGGFGIGIRVNKKGVPTSRKLIEEMTNRCWDFAPDNVYEIETWEQQEEDLQEAWESWLKSDFHSAFITQAERFLENHKIEENEDCLLSLIRDLQTQIHEMVGGPEHTGSFHVCNNPECYRARSGNIIGIRLESPDWRDLVEDITYENFCEWLSKSNEYPHYESANSIYVDFWSVIKEVDFYAWFKGHGFTFPWKKTEI